MTVKQVGSSKNILSLFDGMSCGQIALKELKIPIGKYYASEIDSYAINQTKLNFPKTIHLGDINNWQEWDIEWNEIDLILAGSPCQGFSAAGKQLLFDDPRSKLFFVFVDILNHCRKFNPRVKFLLENVGMPRNGLWVNPLRIISDYVGVQPVNINSNLVSAQNRNRWYWSNIRVKYVGMFEIPYTDIPQPEDEGIILKDIVEDEVDPKYYLSDMIVERFKRTSTNDTDDIIGTTKPSFRTIGQRDVVYGLENKMGPIMATEYKQPKQILIQNKKLSPYQGDVIHGDTDKMQCLSAQGGNKLRGVGYTDGVTIRKLTPTECARVQTIPAWYKWECSDTQQYKMIGNGWTIKIITHILKYLK